MHKIAVVIPCYKVRESILTVLGAIGPEVHAIYVVDDACPQGTGNFVREHSRDHRVRVLFNTVNRGVGGAVIAGYRAALVDGMTVAIKLDGDNQMDPGLIPVLMRPILEGAADYTKGNRFFHLESLKTMPRMRLFGNVVLSLVSKIATGYWDIMDPTNGFTAIHAHALGMLPLDKIDQGYFFESDMLFHLGTLRGVVRDVPMQSRYGDEMSSLRISNAAIRFPFKHLTRLVKRIFYCYFLRDFNVGTVQMILGFAFFGFGAIYGSYHWYLSVARGIPADSGVVMLAALPTILGFQLLLSALNYDISTIPRTPLQGAAPPDVSNSIHPQNNR